MIAYIMKPVQLIRFQPNGSSMDSKAQYIYIKWTVMQRACSPCHEGVFRLLTSQLEVEKG